jgi:alcohol dehydrogenase YqhD (iron-dependent ADH family)
VEEVSLKMANTSTILRVMKLWNSGIESNRFETLMKAVAIVKEENRLHPVGGDP